MMVRISDICTPFSGFTPAASELFPSGKYPYFKVAEMNRETNQRVMTDTDAYVKESRKFFPKGAIVFPKNGAAIATNKKRILGQDSIVDLNTGGVKPNTDIVCTDYLFFLFQHIDFTQYMRRGAVPTLDLKSVLALEIELPSPTDQQRIVAELDLLSGIVEKKNAQLKTLDNLAQSIFHEMFGDPIVNERGWDYKRLDEVAEIVGGATPKTQIEEYWEGDNYWVTPAELHKEHYKGATERTISNEAVRKTNVTLLPVGTVLLSSRAPIGKVAITTVPMYCNQGFKNLICSGELNNEYAFQVLYSNTEYLNSLGTGATFKEISKKTTEAIKIAVPPIELQDRFAERAKKIESEKEKIKASLASAEQLFASRMEKYFNI